MSTPELAVDSGALKLLVDTPDRSLMEEAAQEAVSEYLAGAGKISLDNANLEDSSDYMEKVIANIAHSKGVNLSSAQVKELVTKPFSEMSDSERNYYQDGITISSAQTGIGVANETSGGTYQLYSVTKGVLEDGRLTVNEAANLAASGASMASSFMAGFSKGAAFGPLGAIAGLVMGGVKVLASERTAQRAYWTAREAYAERIVERLVDKTEAFLGDEASEYFSKREIVWSARDSAIAEISDAWASFENSLGVRFGLRYFPGSPTPPRGGTYRRYKKFWLQGEPEYIDKVYTLGSDSEVYPQMCETPSGCAYFPEPHPSRVQSVGFEWAMKEMLHELAKNGEYLTTREDASNLLTGSDYAIDPNFGGLDYYNRAIRACNAFIPRQQTGSRSKYWVPKLERENYRGWKNAGDLAWEWLCWRSDQTNQNAPGCSNRKAVGDCFEQVVCNYSSTQQLAGVEAAKAWFKFHNFGDDPVNEPNLLDRAQDYVQEMYEGLAEFNNSTDVIKTRVLSDLVQTANAVTGEMVTAVRLQKLFDELGTSDVRQLTSADLRSLNAVDDATLRRINQAKVRDHAINSVVLAAGVGAVGLGAHRKWGKK